MTLAGAASFVYTRLLKPAPLRWVTNKMLLFILPRSVALPEGRLLLHPHDPVISGALMLGVYEPFQMEVFRSYVQEGDTVLDIGANIGLYTLIAAKQAGAAGHVFAFEPERENFSILSENIQANDLTTAEAVQCAVSDASGTGALFISEDNKGNHSLIDDSGSGTTQPVETIRMDDWLEERGVTNVGVIKIDIQGAEPRAFAGMERTLRESRALFTEYEPAILRGSGTNPMSMLESLRAYGYRLFEIDENKKTVTAIEDLALFTQRLSGDTYANILGVNQGFAEPAEGV
ncbi:MAG: FkbM family methyltransferase [Patescibacteria group bacterium]